MTNHPNRSRGIAKVAKGNEQLGDTCYLVRLEDLNKGTTSYRVGSEPPRTNMSHAPLDFGWLGTTNNIAAYAEGKCILTGWVGDEGRVRFRRVKS